MHFEDNAAYVPDAGDFVWLTFDLQAGREQAFTRFPCPATVPNPLPDDDSSQ